MDFNLSPVYTVIITSIALLYILTKSQIYKKHIWLASSINTFPFVIASYQRIFQAPAVWDEKNVITFAREAGLHDASTWKLLAAPNLAGYGGAWWSIESLSYRFYEIVGATDPEKFTIFTLRVVSILAVAMLLVMLFRICADKYIVLRLLPILAMSLPLVWWGGKLASPELISGSLAGIGVILLMRNRYLISGLILGAATGIKISAFPLFCACLLLVIIKNKSKGFSFKFSIIKKILSGFVFGFILCNLYLLVDPRAFYHLSRRINPFIASSVPNLSIQDLLSAVFFQNGMHWDAVSKNGLLYWFGGIFTILFVIFLYLHLRAFSSLLVVIATFLVTIFSLIATSALDCPWLYFPTIIFAISLLATLPDNFYNKRSRHINISVLIVMSMAIGISSNLATYEQRQVSNYINDYKSIERDTSCVRNAISPYAGKVRIYSMVMSTSNLAIENLSGGAYAAGDWLLRPDNNEVLLIVGRRSEMVLEVTKNINMELVRSCSQLRLYLVNRNLDKT